MASVVTVGELLYGYLTSAQLWKPATVASYRHVVSTLADDPLCRCRRCAPPILKPRATKRLPAAS
jgi:hypothetical protein